MILILVVVAASIVVSSATAVLVPVGGSDLVRFGVLLGCSWLAIELTRHIERKREYWRSPTSGYIDTKSVWSFAAVIVLPPLLASLMVVLTYSLAWWRIKPHARPGLPHRWIFSCATVLCGTQAAVVVLAVGMASYPGAPGAASLEGLAEFGVIAAAGVLRWAINLGLVMVAIALSSPTARARDLFSNIGEQVLEAGALGLGLVTAAVVVNNPFVLPGVVVAMVALHRGLLVHQYQQASRFDAKTGLTTAKWWHEYADQALAQARSRGRTMGLLIVDLDHFKAINDTYGHPFGDRVLRSVATELLAEVRDEDACGRWGGEEFVVALPDVGDERNVLRVAERIRRRIQAVVLEPPGRDDAVSVTITASVGGTVFPAAGITTLDELVLAADTALYAAKNAGRNTVRMSAAGTPAMPQQRTRPQSAEPPTSAG
ncbi:diguanylate cyclase (GGDEF) domain-containing protein [Jiangella alba]|uniref:Diguanylate cyclase (GGDEF) domain-containing protein n=1 Tax=Jiangella alba TaxID=561176 RepID=A0A1H5PQ07_9ACTN|nr:diguanylate cyclase (GGDEF) domain-containing protein [Jiangella alba]